MRRVLLLIYIIACATNAHAYSSALAALVKNDYTTKADSLTNVLIEQFMNKKQASA